MSDKYYDEVNQYPNSTYPKNNGEITKIKTIRLTQEEEANWDSKAIHEFLSGEIQSNDSIKINKLKQVLRVYDLLFRENMNVIMENDKMSQFILDNDDFNLIGEVL